MATMRVPPLIGRDAECARLRAAIERAVDGSGSVALLSGEAGVGKTRLATEVAEASDALVLRGAGSQAGTEPHAPLVGALRAYLRDAPDGLSTCGPLRGHLAIVLPELGDAADGGDRATMVEAFRCAFATVASRGPTVVILDDLHWSDDATLEVLGALAPSLRDIPLLVVAAYRSDELPRGHSLRRLRAELRRAGDLEELALEPLDGPGSAAVAERVLGAPVSPALARVIHDRTQGIPFFVEELAAALEAGALVRTGEGGVELVDTGRLPVPDTVRDAVLMRTAQLSSDARAAAEVAAVAGEAFDVELVAELAAERGLLELLDCGLVVDGEPGRAAFRHALVRDALYEDVAWLRRRTLHRRIAERLERGDGPSVELATHWLGARDESRGRAALLRAVDDFCAAHAYRDAARAGREALDLWPDNERGEQRVAALERYARCAELAGELAESARAWRELVALSGSPGRAHSNLARVYSLQGDRERATAERLAAADCFAARDQPGDAAAERLSAAAHLQSSGNHARAVALARTAGDEAIRADRIDLRARALGLEGSALAKRGDFDDGVATIRSGLSLALEHDLTAEAADVYQRLGTAFETAADYEGARDALTSALGLCETGGSASTEQTCVACMAYVLREMGDWQHSAELCADLLAAQRVPPGTRVVADGVLGAIHGFGGDLRAARPLLVSSLETARRLDVLSMFVDAAAGLAWIEHVAGADDAALEHCRSLLERWRRSQDHHYAIWGLRLAASLFAAAGDGAGTRACADALAQIATHSGHPYALAALASALGESALLDGDARTAADQLTRAVDLHDGLCVPFERAQIGLRAGVALAAAGERELALDQLGDAYRVARRLGARPLVTRAAAEVDALGESVEQRLGRRAAAGHEGGGLTRRELEVMRLVAVGRTNREIAGTLYLSPRTVDMHVRNILGKLGCRSRLEATSRAHTLGLVP
jgi:DNA-binding CsgD family transcriptional regulator